MMQHASHLLNSEKCIGKIYTPHPLKKHEDFKKAKCSYLHESINNICEFCAGPEVRHDPTLFNLIITQHLLARFNQNKAHCSNLHESIDVVGEFGAGLEVFHDAHGVLSLQDVPLMQVEDGQRKPKQHLRPLQ